MPDGTRFPPTLLTGVYWRFWEEEPIDDQPAFTSRVIEYGKSIDEAFSWDADAVAIRAPRIRVKYFGADPEDESEYADYEGYRALLRTPPAVEWYGVLRARSKPLRNVFGGGFHAIEPGGGTTAPDGHRAHRGSGCGCEPVPGG